MLPGRSEPWTAQPWTSPVTMPPVPRPGVPAIEMRGISKTFTGVRALRDVRLKAWGGEIMALMGENGAGKSTLMKILSGAHRADPGGEILIDASRSISTARMRPSAPASRSSTRNSPSRRTSRLPRTSILATRSAMLAAAIDRKAMEASCAPVLERLGAPFGPRALVGTLSIAEQQMVEIARALHGKSRILVLDEPTTALSSRETDRLFRLVKQLRSEGIAIIYNQPPHGRGVRTRRPRHRASRRQLRRGSRPPRHQCRGHRAHDGRARPVELLYQGARSRRGAIRTWCWKSRD